jgi:hypothetical protein
MKTCTKCKEEKELSEFYKDRKSLSSKCKTCHNKYVKEHQKEYKQSDARKEYLQSDARKQSQKKGIKKYMNTELYFKLRLNRKGFKENDISPELIELQKLSIVTHRYTQQLNQVK